MPDRLRSLQIIIKWHAKKHKKKRENEKEPSLTKKVFDKNEDVCKK